MKRSEIFFTDSKAEDQMTALLLSALWNYRWEVRKLIASASRRTIVCLTSKKGELEIFGKELWKKKYFSKLTWKKLIGKRPFERKLTYRLSPIRKNLLLKWSRQTGHRRYR